MAPVAATRLGMKMATMSMMMMLVAVSGIPITWGAALPLPPRVAGAVADAQQQQPPPRAWPLQTAQQGNNDPLFVVGWQIGKDIMQDVITAELGDPQQGGLQIEDDANWLGGLVPGVASLQIAQGLASGHLVGQVGQVGGGTDTEIGNGVWNGATGGEVPGLSGGGATWHLGPDGLQVGDDAASGLGGGQQTLDVAPGVVQAAQTGQLSLGDLEVGQLQQAASLQPGDAVGQTTVQLGQNGPPIGVIVHFQNPADAADVGSLAAPAVLPAVAVQGA